MSQQWMTPKSLKPSPRQLERVKSQMRSKVKESTINQCCAECRSALKWIKKKAAEAKAVEAYRLKHGITGKSVFLR